MRPRDEVSVPSLPRRIVATTLINMRNEVPVPTLLVEDSCDAPK